MIEETLEEMGLSPTETKIYLSLLKNGSSKSGKIIDNTKLQSSTVFNVLGGLINKGLISYVLKGKIKFYQAEPPESFLLFLEEKKRKFQEILPQLKQMEEKNKKEKSSAKVYEGIKGVQTMFNDILLTLKPGEEYCFFQIVSKRLMEKNVSRVFRSFHLNRAENKIKVRGLVLKKMKNITENVFKDIPYSDIRFVDEFFPHGLIIYANKVVTLEWNETPIAFVIESEEIAESYKQFFNEKWNSVGE